MRKATLLFVILLGLGASGCHPTTTTAFQNGDSGADFGLLPYNAALPYGPPYGSPYNRYGCLWTDTNCNYIYTSPGGG
jgi:hypothetical protein